MSTDTHMDVDDRISSSGCEESYRKLEECIVDSNRDWRRCQAEVMDLRKCCADPTPKAEEETPEVHSANHEELSGRIMFEHGVDRASLVKALRSLLKEATGYVSKICVRLRSKCPEPLVDAAPRAEKKGGDSEGGSDAENGDNETPGKKIDPENDSEKHHPEVSGESDSANEDPKEGEGDPTISTSISAGTPEDGAKTNEAEKQEEELLSEEANKLLDIVFELGQTFPSLIPHLKDASHMIAQEYPKHHGTETSENVDIYTPLQLMRMYFDLILRMQAQKDAIDPGILHIYSVYSFEILRSVAVSLSPTHHDVSGHVPHEIQALTKASEILKPLTLDLDDAHNTARRIVVKIFIAISDMFVLARGLEHGSKLTSALVKLFNTCETNLESVPESLDYQLRNLNDVKNALWLARSNLFKNGKMEESTIHDVQTKIVQIIGGELTHDSNSNVSLGGTQSADTEGKSSEKSDTETRSEDGNDEEGHHGSGDDQQHHEGPSSGASNDSSGQKQTTAGSPSEPEQDENDDEGSD